MKTQKIGTLRTILHVIPRVFAVSPVFFLLFAFVALVHGLLWAVQITSTQNVFDTLQSTINNALPIAEFWKALALLAAVLLLTQIFNALNSFVYTPYNRYVVGHFKQMIHQKAGRLPLDQFEDPRTLDLLNHAETGVDHIFQLAFSTTMLFTFFLPYLIYMLIYFFKIDPMLSLILVLLSLPMLIFQRSKVRLSVNVEEQSVAHRRKADHYKQCIGAPAFFKETRMLGLYSHFMRLFSKELDVLIDLRKENERKRACIQLMDTLLSLVFYVGILLYMIYLIIEGRMSVGAFAAIFAAITGLVNRIKETTNLAGEFGSQVGPIHFFLEFMNLDERQGSAQPLAQIGDICLENAAYRYPGAEKDSLKNIHLHIHKGETVAIVGENGAGKSTLVRLMTGLYLPTEGSVTIGGRASADLPVRDRYRKMSAVFQRYQRYAMTCRDNVRIGQISAAHPDDALHEVLRHVGFPMEILRDSLDTMLSREFGGMDLSGGQWQRLAMARGLLREHELIVLDEPTSAIDPIEETHVYEQFSELVQNKTAVLVTHRLGSARIADRIIVLDKGEIVEVGTHEQLLENHAKYSSMYKQQAQWYQEPSQ